MKCLLFIILYFFSQTSFAQNEFYHIKFVEDTLNVTAPEDTLIFERVFLHPFIFNSDLDGDDIKELLVIDSVYTAGNIDFILYIFNTIDSFYLADSIKSGSFYPYITFSGEIEGLIIVSGNTDFSYINEGSEIKTLPINCWKFEEGDVFSINEELYEIFITENENILSIINNLKTENTDDCGRSIKSLMTSAYINYLTAGENTSAENFLETFYQCNDLESFKKELDNLFYKEN